MRHQPVTRWISPALALFLLSSIALAQSDVTVPTDPTIIVNGVNDGDGNSGPPPANENVEHTTDNFGQKYLNFLDLGSGLIVVPALNAGGGGTILSALRLYTANDATERDPASYLLEGGSSSAGPFTLISQGALNLPLDRNPGGNVPLGAFSQTVDFNNNAGYLAYRLTFPTLRDAAAANSMQIGEVEFIGVPVPEPTSLGLLALGGLAFMARRR